jgi:alpha-1,2-mannosyltransferase
MGQVNFLALVLVLTGIRFLTNHHLVWSGLVFAIAFLVKPHLSLLLLPLLLLGHWRVVLMIAGLGLVALGVSVSGRGLEYIGYYTSHTIPQLVEFAGRALYYNQGLAAFFSRFLPDNLAEMMTLMGSGGVILIASWLTMRRRQVFFSLALFLQVLLFIEPLSWQHHYVFLLPLIIGLASYVRDRRLLVLLFLGYLLVGMNIANPEAISGWPLSFLVLSHVFLGNIFILIVGLRVFL